jgi:hypothetical protein
MFPQSAELNAKLGPMRQAEIRAEFARYHMMRQARAAQPARRPRWVTALLDLVRARLRALGQYWKIGEWTPVPQPHCLRDVPRRPDFNSPRRDGTGYWKA